MVALPTSTTIQYGIIPFGTIDANGVKWRITGFDGWGSPRSSIEPQRKARAAGAWAGDAFTAERYMAVRGQIVAPTPELLNASLDMLYDTVALDDRLFTVAEAGATRWCMVRRTDEVIPGKVTDRIANFSFQVVATDPRKLGTALSASTHLPASSGGLTVPFTVPRSIDAMLVSGQVNLTNSGNETGPVILRVDGPCHGPSITHVASGLTLVFSSSLVLGEGEWLTIDTEARTVMANDQSSRSGYITSRGWFGFVPGDNTFAFTASSFDADALLTVIGTPAHK